MRWKDDITELAFIILMCCLYYFACLWAALKFIEMGY